MDFGNALMPFQNEEMHFGNAFMLSKTKNGFWKRNNAFPKQRKDFGNA